MDTGMQADFLERWRRYFGEAELPLAWFYDNRAEPEMLPDRERAHRCVICLLARARAGKPLALDNKHIGCRGGRRYLGFDPELRANFRYFLSCGIPDEMEGERYKKTPELVDRHLAATPRFEAPGRFIHFRRWDRLEAGDQPQAVVFFATADVLSGLFTLAGYDEADPEAVTAPFGSGCASVVQYPFLEAGRERPRAVLGLFDVSARPCVQAGVLTLAVPWAKFERMAADMDESFLSTNSWGQVRKRIH